jgi:hypothetical protein
MNHPVTIGGMLLVGGFAFGIVLLLCGTLALFAGGMSDNPEAGDGASRAGCICCLLGAAVLVLCIMGLR